MYLLFMKKNADIEKKHEIFIIAFYFYFLKMPLFH